jgi:DNA integrity scanning protein DisA with diadenylate cyclase activity
MSQLKIGLMLAVMNEYVGLDERVLCLSGVAGSERLDTLLIANPRRDFPWFGQRRAGEIHNVVATRELARIIDIALRLAAEGREGRPIGTIFVLGEIDQLSPYLRQLVLNPCRGHPQRERNIHNLDFFETVREFAALDGAFIVDKKGVVHSAGTYLQPPPKKFKLRSGLGARHAAGLSITTVTEAVATVVSSSSGTITIFHEGEVILELERVQSGE